MTSWSKGIRASLFEFLTLAAGNACGAVLSLMLISILTKQMSAEDYGRLSLTLTFVVFVNQAYMTGLSNGSGRLFASARVSGETVPLFRAIANVFKLSCYYVIFLGALFGWLCIWAAGIGSISSAVAVTIVALISGLNSVAIGILNAARWRASVAFLTSADSFFRLLAISGLVYQAHPIDLSAVLWIQAASTSACSVLALCRWRTLTQSLAKDHGATVRTSSSKNWQAQLQSYRGTLSILGLVTFSHQISNYWVLHTFQGAADVGVFAALYQLGFLPFSLLSVLAVNLLAPILFDAIESRSATSNNRSMLINLIAGASMLLITLSACLFGALYGEDICRVVLGESFQVIAPMLSWALLASGLFETGQVLALRLQARMALRQLMWIKGSASCIGIGLNIVGTWHAGVQGLLGASLMFSSIYLVAIMTWLLRDARLSKGNPPLLAGASEVETLRSHGHHHPGPLDAPLHDAGVRG